MRCPQEREKAWQGNTGQKLQGLTEKENFNHEKRAAEKQTPADKNQINIVYTVEKPRDGPRTEI